MSELKTHQDLKSMKPMDISTGDVAGCSKTIELKDGVDNISSSISVDCPICLQTCIHPALLPCGHIFCFLCVKGVTYKNRRCAMCRREIPTEFLDHPQLVNGNFEISKTKMTVDGYQWFYEGRNGWWQYDERTSLDIEEAYNKREKTCTILVAGYVYVIDFEGMFQQRQNEPTRKRNVKRDLASIAKKGVAGLRIEGNPFTDLCLSAGSNSGCRIRFNSADHPNLMFSSVSASNDINELADDPIGSLTTTGALRTNNLITSDATFSKLTRVHETSSTGENSEIKSISSSEFSSSTLQENRELVYNRDDHLNTVSGGIDNFQETVRNFGSISLADFRSDSKVDDSAKANNEIIL